MYLAGLANSNSGIAYNGFKSTHGGGYWDIFLVKFNSAGARQWATYYGGSQIEHPQGLSITNSGDIYISGVTYSSDSSAYNGFQNTHGGQSDALLVKLKDSFCQPTSDTIYDSLCFNTGIWFNGANRFNSGTYFDTLVNAKGCDSFLTLKLFIRPKVSNTINQFICTGQSYLFNGILRTTSGTYFDTLMNNQGCDSFLTLNLSVKSSDTLHVFDTICETQSYLFNNQTFFNSGIYRDTFMSSQGCDSFIFLHLYVKDSSYHLFSHITPCDPNASFMFNGLARTQSGTYSAKYLNAVNCDSTAVLNLTIRKPSSFSFPRSLCPGDSFMFNGSPRTTTGTYVQTIINGNSVGCDSTVTLNLIVLTNPAPITNQVSGCSPFTYNGKTYMNSTTFLDTIKSVLGCDSLYRTNIIQLKPPPITAPEVNIIVCDSIRINNRLYTTSFSFIDTFRTVGTVCDSLYRKTNYTIRSTPQIGLKERDTFMRGSQVTLRSFSATNYLWSTGETTKNLSFKLTEDRQLYLIAWNEEPCRDTAYISLVAEDLAIVGMPTGFSPTGEHQENRTLRPNINGRLEYFHMMVFNRWGEKVYETFDTQPLGWNGIFKGEPAPKGLYGYVLEYRTLGVIYNKSGEVMLVR